MVPGFLILQKKEIPEYASTALLLEHERTGCKVYHLFNDDPENLFAFVFRTPPENNTGVAHVLEHAVLSGSRGFQLKDPFIALMKGSVNTFLNAITYPDKTIFPAASILEKDYFNLLEVYGDAVFFPLLRKEVFLQEGRRIQIEDSGDLSIDGIVYNEMKGSYSDHDSIVGEWSYRSLFPDSPYRFDSGGEPGAIRELTYEQFMEFHQRWYHPSNCLIFLYGNIPTSKILGFLERRFLHEFGRVTVDTEVPLQSELCESVNLTLTSPLAAEDTPDEKSTITLNWIVGRIEDPYRLLSLEVLAEILLGNPGAPLYRAIQESDLGEDLSPVSGIDTDTRELVFTFGLRGTRRENLDAFTALVTGELEKLAKNGIPEDVIRGTLARVEFRNREIRGGMPFGLRLLGKTLRGWLHGSKPETTLEFAPWMEKLKREVRKGNLFEGLVSECFLNNRNRSTVTVIPSHEHEKREIAEFEQWERGYREKLTDRERSLLLEEREAFQLFQETPDKPETLMKIPSLSLDDIPRKVESIDTRSGDIAGVPFYFLNTYTNGIVYIDMVFDIQDISDELTFFFPLLCRVVVGAGLPGMRYDEVARRLTIETGGFTSFLEINSLGGCPESNGADGRESRAFVVFRMKALESSLNEALRIVTGLITEADLSDTQRLRDILFEFRNDVKAQILPAGSSFTALRAGSRISPVLAREELWKGIEQVLFLYKIADDIDSQLPLISEKLRELRTAVINRARLTLNLTAERTAHEKTRELLADFVARLPVAPVHNKTRFGLSSINGGARYESIAVPSMVSYVSTVFPASSFLSPHYAHEAVVAQYLKTGFLWEEVRLKGGAYGVTAAVNGTEMLFSLSSYRDPKVAETLDTYRTGFDGLIRHGISSAELEKAIIGIVGRELRPLSPGEKGVIGFRRRLYEITDDLRQRKRDELIAGDTGQIREAAIRLRENLESACSVVMTGDQALSAMPERYSGLRVNRINLV